MKKFISFIIVLILVSSVSSCYKIFKTTAPTNITAGDTFQVTVTVIHDGDANAQFKNDWSVAGVRVPKGWIVSAPSMNHRQFAEPWVYYEDGTQAAKKAPMSLNANLSKIYNDACNKDGYEWFGFQTRAMVPKCLTSCWRNGCDSIVGTFNVIVPEDYTPGTYTIDFIAGDEEDAAGVDKYTSFSQATSTRVFQASTFSNSYFKRVTTSGARKIVVNANTTAIKNVSVESKESENIYTIEGVKLAKPRKGINIIDGKKIINK